MKSMASELVERLNVDTAFTIPLFGGIPVAESVVITWVVMAILVLLAIWLTHGMTVQNPSKKQLVVEAFVSFVDNFTGEILGPYGKQYSEYLGTVLIYIGLANITGLLGLKPPTKDLNVTIGLAVMSIILIEAAGIRARGLKGWAHSFAEPIAIVTPINILEIFIRPLSLCMRLFGNVLGSFVIMELIEMLIPVGVPIIFSLYFDIFDGFIQAYVFVFLTGLFIQEAVEPAAPSEKKEKKKKKQKALAA
ncbi:MAG: F0F1 ATP synthase subunit A [Lachnospiraceae bacterium]